MHRYISAFLSVFLLFSFLSCNDFENEDAQSVTVVDQDAPPSKNVWAELVGFDQFGTVRYNREKQRARRSMTFQRVPTDVVTVTLNYTVGSSKRSLPRSISMHPSPSSIRPWWTRTTPW